MRLSDFITPERAVVALGADTVTAAADVLLARLVASGAVQDPEKLERRIEEERPEDIVAMGDRAFLVHTRTNAVADLSVAIGTAERPICRALGESDEVQCARIVLLIVAPPRMATRYLQVVGALARLLSKEKIVDQVLAQRSAADLAELPAFREYEIAEQITVRDLMTERPHTVIASTELLTAARDMVRRGIRGVPVVDEAGRVVGMLGERELIRVFQNSYLTEGRGGIAASPGPAGIKGLTVRDAMTRQVLCVSPEQPLAEVSVIMANKDVERVPVVREGRIVGLLTRGDIVRKLIGR